ncbi:hypothetical protein PO124_29640 [Bacillus licheniformis]|nr:hypothetical protein [Bacillus licheniformis]
MKQGMLQIQAVPVDAHSAISTEMDFYRLLSKIKCPDCKPCSIRTAARLGRRNRFRQS